MEKKELRERLTELAIVRGFVCEAPSGKLKDLELTFNQKELVGLIDQEIDKAREEVLIELQKEFSEFGVPDDVRYTQPLFYINEVIEKKLSKLKTKEDGK